MALTMCACSKKDPAPPSEQPKKQEPVAEAGRDWVGELEGKNPDGGAWKIQVWNCSDKIEGPWNGFIQFAVMHQSSAYDTRSSEWPAINVTDKPSPITVKTKTKYTTFPEMTVVDGDESRRFDASLEGKRTFVLTEPKYDKASMTSTAMFFTLFGANSNKEKTLQIPLKGDQCDGKNPKTPIQQAK
jgi:hypothetical protein